MKKLYILPQLIGFSMLVGLSCTAQSDSTQQVTNRNDAYQPVTAQNDSIRPVYNKQVAKLIAKVAQDSAKLIRFKGLVPEYKLDKRRADSSVQQSADDNKRVADRLAEDPQNRKLSRQANSAATQARNDSRRARTSAKKLDRLNVDIARASQKLENDEQKLARSRGSLRATASRQ